jgi:prepilin-type processing-associated H-X9-DG protein
VLAYLLPYVEQENIYKQLQVNWDAEVNSAAWFTLAANTAPARARIKSFECPAAPTTAPEFYLGPHRHTINGSKYEWAVTAFTASANLGMTNYCGVAGRFGILGPNVTIGGVGVDTWKGVYVPSRVRMIGSSTDVPVGRINNVLSPDGTSNTFAFGETLGYGWPAAPLPQGLKSVWPWISAGSFPTFSGVPNGPDRWFGEWSSNHTGVVQFAYCDGSVRGIRSPCTGTTPVNTFIAVSTIGKGEVVDISSIGN